MPRGRNFWGRGFWKWGYGYPYFGFGRGNPFPFCRWFPWLPRGWWTGIYGPTMPYRMPTTYAYTYAPYYSYV